MKKYILQLAFIIMIAAVTLIGCKKTKDEDIVSQTANLTITPTAAITEDIPASETEVTGTAEDPDYDVNFKLILEAEDATYSGNIKVENSKQGYTGTGYLTGMQSEGDTITFTVNVPGNGAYDLNFISAGNTGHKENNVLLDGENIGLATVDKDDFTDSILNRVYLTKGEHQVQMTKNWGWVLVDSLIVTASKPMDTSIYEISDNLCDPKATDSTKRLMRYLTDTYGKYIISGQYGNLGILGPEFTAINNATGKYPAILGLDLIDYTPSRTANGATGHDVDYATAFHKKGGIVTFCWHWNAPEPYLINSEGNPWWRGFYTDATTIDLSKIMNGDDPEGYELLLQDIDAIAVQLKRLQTADIPILWRPLHEASGGWFWWGASGADAYKKLYQLLYDRLVNYHDIHNLIWVWNGQNKDWYPGDEYVDIVATDIYPGEKIYSSQADKFFELADWTQDSRKLIALSENGCMFDPDLAVRDNAMWLYFGTWEGEFVVKNNTYTLSEQYTETDMLKKIYTSDKVITLDELPDLTTYGN
jgi:mannan endo-1,4-beta-mannosidase